MPSNTRLTKSRSRRAAAWFVVAGLFILWGSIISTGTRLPYLYTEFAFQVRAFFIFPVLLIALIYISFIRRNGNQQTGYMSSMSTLPHWKDKIKATAWGLSGMILISGGCAWSSVAFSAWAAKLLATVPYEGAYRVESIATRSGAAWSTLFDLHLIDVKLEEKATLRLGRSQWENRHWKAGECIFIRGRTSVFGVIIDMITPVPCLAWSPDDPQTR